MKVKELFEDKEKFFLATHEIHTETMPTLDEVSGPYSSYEEAKSDINKVAKEEGISPDDLIVSKKNKYGELGAA